MMLRIEEIGRQRVDATHLGGMMHDKSKVGRKRADSSVNICGATPFVSQKIHVLVLLEI